MTAVNIKQLVCYRGGLPLFSPVSIALKSGSIGLIRGKNGIGKSTLLKSVFGTFIDYEGMIEKKEANCAFLGHRVFLKPYMTLKQHMAFYLIDEKWLHLFALNQFQHKKISEFSEGMKQKLRLSIIFSQEKDIYILDEPLLSLDSESSQIVWQAFEKVKAKGKTILFSHHGHDFPKALVDKEVRLG